MNRQKDLQYSSRAASHIKRQRQLHQLRHVITDLAKFAPEEVTTDERYAELVGYGCDSKMHVIRLLAPALDTEDHANDIDFSPEGIRLRREAGYRHTCETLEKAPWREPSDPLAGFVLYEAMGGEVVHTSAAG